MDFMEWNVDIQTALIKEISCVLLRAGHMSCQATGQSMKLSREQL
jgi:hypothetical protein